MFTYKCSDDRAVKKFVLSSFNFNNVRWGTTERGKWPRYDVEGNEDDFNRRFRLKKTKISWNTYTFEMIMIIILIHENIFY